jgi:hypothetical protein
MRKSKNYSRNKTQLTTNTKKHSIINLVQRNRQKEENDRQRKSIRNPNSTKQMQTTRTSLLVHRYLQSIKMMRFPRTEISKYQPTIGVAAMSKENENINML